jgi:hypothetical protein
MSTACKRPHCRADTDSQQLFGECAAPGSASKLGGMCIQSTGDLISPLTSLHCIPQSRGKCACAAGWRHSRSAAQLTGWPRALAQTTYRPAVQAGSPPAHPPTHPPVGPKLQLLAALEEGVAEQRGAGSQRLHVCRLIQLGCRHHALAAALQPHRLQWGGQQVGGVVSCGTLQAGISATRSECRLPPVQDAPTASGLLQGPKPAAQNPESTPQPG